MDRQTDDMLSQDRALHYSASRGKKTHRETEQKIWRRGTATRVMSVEILSTDAKIAFEKACNRWMILKVTQGRRNCRYLTLMVSASVARYIMASRRVGYIVTPIITDMNGVYKYPNPLYCNNEWQKASSDTCAVVNVFSNLCKNDGWAQCVAQNGRLSSDCCVRRPRSTIALRCGAVVGR